MKKTGKKLVSLLLAVVMVLSTLTVGFVAFAADEETPATLDEVVALVTDADPETITEEEVAHLVARYATLSTSGKGNFKKNLDAYSKYIVLVRGAADDYDYAEEVENFVTTPVDRVAIGGDVIWTEGGIQSAVDGLWEMISSKNQLGKVLGLLGIDLSNGIEPLLAPSLYTSDTIEMIFDLYAMLSHDETPTGIEGFMAASYGTLGLVVENALAKYVNEAFVNADGKFDAAAAKLAEIKKPSKAEIAAGDTWCERMAAVDFTDEDLALDGTQDALIDALLASLRPVELLLTGELDSILKLAGLSLSVFDQVQDDGSVKLGLYTLLVPMLEQLGCTDLPTVDDYRLAYADAVAAAPGGKNHEHFDLTLRPIVESVFDNILNPILADPLNGLVEVLPRLAYCLESGLINDTVTQIVEVTGAAAVLGDVEIPEITSEFVNEMIPEEVDLTELLGMPLVLSIPEIDFAALANCATVEVIESAGADSVYRLIRVADVDSCFTEVFKLLYGILTNEQLLNTLQGALEDLLGADIDPDTGMTNAETLLSMYTKKKLTVAKLRSWGEMGEVAAYGDFLGTFGKPTGAEIEKPAEPEVPVDPENPDVKPPVNPDDKAPTVPNDGNKKPSIPNTGVMESVEMSTVAGASVAYIAAATLIAAAVYMLLKKKEVEE